MDEFSLNIDSRYECVLDAAEKLLTVLEQNNIEEHIKNAFNICLTEAANNVIKHGYKEEPGNEITIKLRKEGDYLVLEIIDEGLPRPNLDIPDLEFDPEDIDNLPESGMGLYIIKQLMDDVNYFSINGKNYFILKKSVS
ncbi:putative anti-sigma regulatory factor, serine/threonine protein kinase [Melioribacter roseus P3M-2]|jgi:serine/threonine-protein kinase RsbW|uniref:Putative anti-sigma regulatory factor, serine/threonine protein kinase n=1 Tax=Melioribacter roseus (strain DSM 23840 / JCM 17771 / VKM B-2668 / P3M-2) TaxID=1191523 RepID=I6YTK2_MELRP|nr:ATP-binding protein [Melioribacter roseus]AFN73872.1 putative anti-sigma regulatory factor, serine/threonine protein kinase [Melioribacter roseus P3M-2]